MAIYHMKLKESNHEITRNNTSKTKSATLGKAAIFNSQLSIIH